MTTTTPLQLEQPMPQDAQPTPQEVARYYDRATPMFLLLGQGRKARVIHRGLWTPSVHSLEDSSAEVDRIVRSRFTAVVHSRARPGPRLLDLGCGVGASALEFARSTPGVEVLGVTVSPLQVRAAERLARAAGLADRCRFLVRDFTDLTGLGTFDGAYAIESFVHTARPAAFFSAAAAHLRPGGRIVLCDDVLGERASKDIADERPRRAREAILNRLKRGWRLGSLLPVEDIVELAAAAGLRLSENRDLTPFIRLGRPRDRFIHVMLSALLFHPRLFRFEYMSSLLGGDALQRALRERWVEYRVLVFDRCSDVS